MRLPDDSYDLDLDTRLSEETTVLVETYTVSSNGTFTPIENPNSHTYSHSCQMDE